MTRISVLICLLSLMSCSSSRSIQNTALITYDISELDTLINKGDRPIIIFMHAPWCSYCRNMEHTTFTNEGVKERLSSEFYFVSFDGEDKRDLTYNDSIYTYVPHSHTSGTNELTKHLGTIDGQIVYPTLILMSPEREIIRRYGTFLTSKELLAILKISKA